MKYAAIEAHRSQFPVALMCRALGVNRSGFYAAGKRPVSARAKRDEELRGRIGSIHQASRCTYGSPRVHAELQAHGEQCSRKRVARLMRQDGLRVRAHRRHGHRRLIRSTRTRLPVTCWRGALPSQRSAT